MKQTDIGAVIESVLALTLPELTELEEARCIHEAQRIAAAVPQWWIRVADCGPAGGWYVHSIAQDISVITTVDYHEGRCWQHASIARKTQMPDYRDLRKLKEEFIGEERKAIMILPAASEHVNLHNYCLHLFCCLDDDPLPDFTRGTGSI